MPAVILFIAMEDDFENQLVQLQAIAAEFRSEVDTLSFDAGDTYVPESEEQLTVRNDTFLELCMKVSRLNSGLPKLHNALHRHVYWRVVYNRIPPRYHSVSPLMHIAFVHESLKSVLSIRHDSNRPFLELFNRVDALLKVTNLTYFVYYRWQDVEMSFTLRADDTIAGLRLPSGAKLVVRGIPRRSILGGGNIFEDVRSSDFPGTIHLTINPLPDDYDRCNF